MDIEARLKLLAILEEPHPAESIAQLKKEFSADVGEIQAVYDCYVTGFKAEACLKRLEEGSLNVPGTCKRSFSKRDNDLAYNLYAQTQNHFTCPEWDQGYTDYYGATKGHNNRTTEAEEVLERLAGNREKYGVLLMAAIGHRFPLLLDPRFPLGKLKERIQAETNALDKLLRAQGLEKDSEEYKTRSSVGLFYLASLPDSPGKIKKSEQYWRDITSELVALGLGTYREHLLQKGGLTIDETPPQASAVPRINQSSYLLFLAFREAGFKNARFFSGIARVSDLPDSGAIKTRKKGGGEGATSGVMIGVAGNERYFNPALVISHPPIKGLYPKSLRQVLSIHYAAEGEDAYLSHSNLDRALVLMDIALKIDPNNIFALERRGFFRKTREDFAGAQTDFEIALAVDPSYPLLLVHLGDIHFLKGNYAEALPLYNRAVESYLKIDPNHPLLPQVYAKRGNVYLALNDTQRAEEDSRKSFLIDLSEGRSPDTIREDNLYGVPKGGAEITPDKYQDFFARGQTSYSEGNFKEAVALFTWALRANPRMPEAYYYRGLAWQKIGESQRAALDFHEALFIDPKHLKSKNALRPK